LQTTPISGKDNRLKRKGILLIAGVLFIFTILSPTLAVAEEKAASAPVAAKPAEKSAPAKTEQPKAEAKKAEPKAETPAPKPEEKKPAEAKSEVKKQESKPAEQKPQPKPEDKKTEKKPEVKKPAVKPAEKKQPPKNEKWKKHIQEKHEIFLKWFEKSYPDRYKHLIQNRDNQPDKFAQRIGEAMKKYGPILREEQRNPELAKALKEDLRLLEQRDRLMHDICKAKPEQRQAIFDQLKGVVAARFDIIIRKKQLQYDDVRKRLKNLHRQLEKRAEEMKTLKNEKDAKVEQRLNELINPEERLNWK
jgi:hypothetical protein